MKRWIPIAMMAISVICLLFFVLPVQVESVVESVPTTITYEPFVKKPISYIELSTIEEVETAIDECDTYLSELYQTTSHDMSDVSAEINRITDMRDQYQMDLDALLAEKARWDAKYEEYPTATIVWKYLTEDMGLNDYVAAGIMGNLMSETGGRTLDLTWDAYSRPTKGYYGICQWSKKYYPSVYGASLEDQLAFLAKTIKKEFDVYGKKCHKKGFNYQSFTELTDEREAALAFARCYERSAKGGHARRQRNATRALAYFTK
jgi:hypothetical protein